MMLGFYTIFDRENKKMSFATNKCSCKYCYRHCTSLSHNYLWLARSMDAFLVADQFIDSYIMVDQFMDTFDNYYVGNVYVYYL